MDIEMAESRSFICSKGSCNTFFKAMKNETARLQTVTCKQLTDKTDYLAMIEEQLVFFSLEFDFNFAHKKIK